MADRRAPCHNCDSVTAVSHRGWRLNSGAYAVLCRRCWSAYEDGTFCEIFHSNYSGWTFCERCDRVIHCNCAISFGQYVTTDLDGVICKACHDCVDAAVKKELPSDTTITKILQRSNAGPSGTKDAVASSSAQAAAPTHDEPADPAVKTEASRQGDGAHVSGTSGRKRDALVPDASGWVPLHPRYRLNARSIPSSTDSKVLVLEKRLSAKDANSKHGSITIPKRIAETYFCKLSLGTLASVAVKDKDGVDWNLMLSLEPKGSRLMYTLQGLGHFISQGQCKAGDKVTLHMVEGSRRFIIGFIDGSA
ncbi:PREDICTED: B3 domain-containing transcription repressor VAL1-like [Tarenaya hassleriana]|uniref:B3 domain-containing transcription repressor VAL1-like n=1 Tax=Tarenaya hassleriana TaxID=28532 RepID=UPI00053C202A|nr:PREDICTED: B3 domain-containing transcription repressor VAL1-like [Tarenaya hassleriana]XP_019057879.1 PREDICTED: B3 domain-containing transcription repressor VAL1-like [Tarenaya hassleriana]